MMISLAGGLRVPSEARRHNGDNSHSKHRCESCQVFRHRPVPSPPARKVAHLPREPGGEREMDELRAPDYVTSRSRNIANRFG